jgi:hypothetical protein
VHQHLLRLGLVFGVAGGALVAARHYLIPPTFGEAGHYRAAAVGAIASRAMKYAGRVECLDCHKKIVQEARLGNHRGVSCEVCHGPAAAHAESGGDTTTQALKPRQFCPVCHAYNASRPTGFPQIDPVQHNALKVCTKCHNPHAPVPPRTPGECKACHGQIAGAKGMSQHARLPCTSCHTVSEQHKVSPRAVAAMKPTDASSCVRCHDQPDVALRGDAAQVRLDSHYPRNLCWDCHYPHNPRVK